MRGTRCQIILGMAVATTAVASPSWKGLVGPSLARHTTTQQQEALVEAAKARAVGARSGYFPQLVGITQVSQQEATTSTRTGVGAAFAPSTQMMGRFMLTQNLFRGGRDRALDVAATHGIEASVADVETSKRQMFQTLIQLWGSCRLAVAEEAALNQWTEVSRSRHQVLSERIRLGRSRAVDLQAQEVQENAIQAQMLGIQSDRAFCESEASKILPSENIRQWAEDFELPPDWKGAVTRLGTTPFKGPELTAMQAREAAARDSISAQRSGHWPSVDVTANAYLFRPGVQKDVNWDVMVQLTLPLFQGGAVSARVAEAAHEAHRQEVMEAEWIRNRDITNTALAQQLLVRDGQLAGLKASWTKAQQLAKSLQHDSQLGLANNLDWLQAEQNALEAGRQWLRAQVQWKVAWLQWRWNLGEPVPFEPSDLPSLTAAK